MADYSADALVAGRPNHHQQQDQHNCNCLCGNAHLHELTAVLIMEVAALGKRDQAGQQNAQNGEERYREQDHEKGFHGLYTWTFAVQITRSLREDEQFCCARGGRPLYFEQKSEGMKCVDLGTVLVVEDNDLVRESFCHVLRQRGYRVVEAQDGEDALEKLDTEKFDIAIVDIMMPSVGGLELRQVLYERTPPLPTILVTGQPDLVSGLVEDDPEFVNGTVSLLQKPVHPVKLLAEVEKRIAR